MLDLIYFGNSIVSYLIFFGIIISSIILGKIVFYISQTILRKKVQNTKTNIDDILVRNMEKPLVFLIFIIGLIFSFKTLILSVSIDKTISNIIKILLTIDIFWFVIYFIDAILVHYISPIISKSKSELHDVLLPIVRKLVKVILFILAAIIIIDNFGYDVTSLIAGLGIGGLAFALAAKDMLSNLFGGASILTDRPFKLGDRIKIEGYDGWVKEIGLRTTKMKTLDGFELIIPNSKITANIIENVSREDSRKTKVTIGVEYGTSMEKMDEAKKILENIILKNKDTKDEVIVSFNEFADSSLNFLIIYWIKNLDNILGVKHQINMEIKKQFEKAKIEMAFPSTTVYLKK